MSPEKNAGEYCREGERTNDSKRVKRKTSEEKGVEWELGNAESD